MGLLTDLPDELLEQVKTHNMKFVDFILLQSIPSRCFASQCIVRSLPNAFDQHLFHHFDLHDNPGHHDNFALDISAV